MLFFKQATHLQLKNILPAFLLAFFMSIVVNAQDSTAVPQQEQIQSNFNDQELQQFANAAGKVMVLQQETEQKMIQAIEDENLELEKFNEILQSQQNQEIKADASEEEMQSFNSAAEKIMKIQTEVQTDMMKVIEEEGLEPQKYEQILMAYQSDPEIKARIDAMLHKEVAE